MDSLYSNAKREFTIKEGCPWYEAQQKYQPANVNWCEPTVCSVINEPANTWSNLGFILVGILLIKKLNEFSEKLVTHFAWAVILMGFFSFTYHASNNYLSQFFDFVGMYLMTSMMIAFNLKRVCGQNPRQLYSLYWFIMSLNVSLFMVFDIADIAVQHTVIINVVPMIILDLYAGYKEGSLKNYKFFALGLVFIIVAQVFSQLDLKRIWCEPENIFFHGHAIWHVLGSISMLFTGLHMSKILKLKY